MSGTAEPEDPVMRRVVQRDTVQEVLLRYVNQQLTSELVDQVVNALRHEMSLGAHAWAFNK